MSTESVDSVQRTIRIKENLNGEYDPETQKNTKKEKKAGLNILLLWGLWLGGSILLIYIIDSL